VVSTSGRPPASEAGKTTLLIIRQQHLMSAVIGWPTADREGTVSGINVVCPGCVDQHIAAVMDVTDERAVR